MVGSGLVMLTHAGPDVLGRAPRNQRVDKGVAPFACEVLLGEAQASEVVGVVGELQVAGDPGPADLPGQSGSASTTTFCSSASSGPGPRIARARRVCSGVTR